MKRTHFVSYLCLAAALAAPGFVLPTPSYAQAIESEPLDPIPLTPSPSASAQAQAPARGASPYSSTILNAPSPTAPTGAAPAYPGAQGADSGMSGMDGGASSVYDLQKSGSLSSKLPEEPAGSSNTGAAPEPVDGRETEPYKPADLPAWPSPDKTTRPDNPALADKTFCTLNISFNSLSSGPDQATDGKVKAYLDKHADIVTYKKLPWGRQGEYRYCLEVEEHNKRSKVYAGLKRLLPPKGSNTSRTTLYGEGFATVFSSDPQ